MAKYNHLIINSASFCYIQLLSRKSRYLADTYINRYIPLYLLRLASTKSAVALDQQLSKFHNK